jgi:hypothetical protein
MRSAVVSKTEFEIALLVRRDADNRESGGIQVHSCLLRRPSRSARHACPPFATRAFLGDHWTVNLSRTRGGARGWVSMVPEVESLTGATATPP